MFGINFILLVLIQVTCIFIFLSVFFFTYAAKVEEDIVKSQVKFVIDDLVGTNSNVLPGDIKEIIQDNINSIDINSDYFKTQNKIMEDNNDKIKTDLYTKIAIVSGGLVGIIIVSYILNKYFPVLNDHKQIHLKSICMETIVILLFVALTEYMYLTYFAARNISVRPNLIKAQIANKLNNSLM